MSRAAQRTRGTLFIISAPSGAGKTSLVRALTGRLRRLTVSISHTTRPRRRGEAEGAHYHFVDHDSFEAMVAGGAFLEHARVFGHLYGTSRSAVEARLAAGEDVILEIDWQGARQVCAAMPEAVAVFILPPSRAELERRLRARGQDSDDVIEARMQAADDEMSHYDEYDYLVVNETFDDALGDLLAIVRARRLRFEVQAGRYADELAELLRTCRKVR